jgi:hypothetical protein
MFAEARRYRVADADGFDVAEKKTGITEARCEAAKGGVVQIR